MGTVKHNQNLVLVVILDEEEDRIMRIQEDPMIIFVIFADNTIRDGDVLYNIIKWRPDNKL